jgi:hypothetical protein
MNLQVPSLMAEQFGAGTGNYGCSFAIGSR